METHHLVTNADGEHEDIEIALESYDDDCEVGVGDNALTN